jgi:hypothetical protein
VFPFFSAAMLGTFQTLPKILASNHGRGVLSVLAGTAFYTALANMADPNDEDKDGHSKYLYRASSWTGIDIGGKIIPLPHELRLPLVAANLAAASMTDRKVDSPTIWKHATTYLTELLPVRPSPFDDSPVGAGLGLLGLPMMLAWADKDQYGRDIVSPNTFGAALPDHLRGRPRDSNWSVSRAREVAEYLKADIAPGKITLAVDMALGSWISTANAYAEGERNGAGGDAVLKSLFKAFSPSRDEFGVRDRFRQREKDAAFSASLPDASDGAISGVQTLEAANKALRRIKGTRQVMDGMMAAKRAGDNDAYLHYRAQLDALNERRSQIQAQTTRILDD